MTKYKLILIVVSRRILGLIYLTFNVQKTQKKCKITKKTGGKTGNFPQTPVLKWATEQHWYTVAKMFFHFIWMF